jgi:methyl-accepting chemotaxis protein
MKIPFRLPRRDSSASRPALRLVARWRDHLRYHGVWAPGVRWVRNMTLRSKAALLLAALLASAAPLVAFTASDIMASSAQAAQTEQRLLQIEAANELERVVARSRTEWQSLESLPTDMQRQALWATELAAYEDLALHMMSPEPAGLLATGWQRLNERRTALQTLLSGDAGLGELRQALGRYHAEVRLLDLQLVDASGLSRHADEGVRALATGGLTLLTRVQEDLERAAHLEVELGVSDLSDGPVLVRWIQTALHASVLMGEAKPQLQRAAALGLMDPGSLDVQLLRLDQLLTRSIDAATLVLSTNQTASQPDAASDRNQNLGEAMDELGRLVTDLRRASIDAIELQVVRTDAETRNALWLQAAIVLGLLLASTYLVVCIFKVLGGGLKALCDNVEALSEGRFNLLPSAGRGRDEVGRALTLLGQAASRLSRLFDAVGDGVGAVTIASREVASGNGSLAARTQAIRRDITVVTERANAFLDLMGRSSQEVEAAVVQVNAMNGDARRARKAMGGLQERMRELNARSREITQMVRMMESVAFQTRLLALNASVEAARAGAEGKGFAVVAQEVRSLAQRNEDAAQRIDEIVAASLAVIEECTLMTERAAEAVQQTDRKIEAVHRSMGVIVAQAREGMSASHDVAGATRGVEESIDGNVRVVDQLSVASTDLRQQGEALRESVAAYLVR